MGMDYSAVAAKLKAMHGGMLLREDFNRLAEKESVSEICAYLKGTDAYGEVLHEVEENSAHRREIEALLNYSLLKEYERLYSFMDRDKRTILKFWFIRSEISLLTAGLRHVFTHEKLSPRALDTSGWEFFDTHSRIDITAIAAAKSLSEVQKACENTPYYDILKRADEAQSDFFSIAMSLDGYYYKTLWHTAEKMLDKSELAVFRELCGSIIDMLNIMWIYRGKKYFKLNSELIYTYLLPVRFRLTSEQLSAMVNADDAEKVAALTVGTRYETLFAYREQGYFIEELYQKEVNDISRRIFRDYPKTMAAVFAYLRLKEGEIHAVTMIIEGVRYRYDPAAIKRHIDISGREL